MGLDAAYLNVLQNFVWPLRPSPSSKAGKNLT